MGKWLSYGGHDTPMIIRMGPFGTQPGATYLCRCGLVHTAIDNGKGGLDWDEGVIPQVPLTHKHRASCHGPAGELQCDPANEPATGPVIHETGARLVPHPRVAVAAGIRDLLAKQGINLSTIQITEVLRVMEDYGWLAFREPVAEDQA